MIMNSLTSEICERFDLLRSAIQDWLEENNLDSVDGVEQLPDDFRYRLADCESYLPTAGFSKDYDMPLVLDSYNSVLDLIQREVCDKYASETTASTGGE